jgi:probable HAF family extracellular repeat protein
MHRRSSALLLASFVPVFALVSCQDGSLPSAVQEELSHSRALAEPLSYTAVDLGTLGGSFSVAMDVNEQGDVVGYSETAEGTVRAFLWNTQTGMRDLGAVPGTDVSRAYAINNQGEVVGLSDEYAIIWSEAEGMRVLDEVSLPGPGGGSPSWQIAWDINDNGMVIGNSDFTAALWNRTVAVQRVICGLDTYMFAINDHGVVGGEAERGRTYGNRNRNAVTWSLQGGCQDHVSPNLYMTYINDINNGGMLGSGGARYHAVPAPPDNTFLLRSPILPMVFIPHIGHRVVSSFHGLRPVGPLGMVESLNEAGDAGGYLRDPSNRLRAHLWTIAGGETDLGTLGGSESSAMGINGAREIVGWSRNAEGHMRATLWTTEPEGAQAAPRMREQLRRAPLPEVDDPHCAEPFRGLIRIRALDSCPDPIHPGRSSN